MNQKGNNTRNRQARRPTDIHPSAPTKDDLSTNTHLNSSTINSAKASNEDGPEPFSFTNKRFNRVSSAASDSGVDPAKRTQMAQV